MDQSQARVLIASILKEIAGPSGTALTDNFSGLRAVDAKVREFKMILRDAGASALLDEMEKDADFEVNSRRVRLEALGNYCRTTLKFFQTGAVQQQKQLIRGPDLTKMTHVMPEL